ncbi:MAG: hypothetical protein MZV64_00475 [Ignavibacteriales bacterium]|nr:hypothetical protein [Ignavibacteriales bacterium]
MLKNLDFLGIDYLIPIGGDDTLSYGVRLYQEGLQGGRHPQDDGQRRAGHRLLHRLQHLRHPHHPADQQPAHHRRLARALPGAGGLRALRRLHRHAAHHGGRGQPLRDPRIQVQHRPPDRTAGVRPQPQPQQLLGGAGLGRRHVRRRRDGLPGQIARTPTATPSWAASATWCRSSIKDFTAKYNNGKTDQHHQPEAGLHGARRRPGRHRLDRPDGLRQPGARPDPEGHPRAPGGAQERALRQHAARCGHQHQETGQRRSDSTTPSACARTTKASR